MFFNSTGFPPGGPGGFSAWTGVSSPTGVSGETPPSLRLGTLKCFFNTSGFPAGDPGGVSGWAGVSGLARETKAQFRFFSPRKVRMAVGAFGLCIQRSFPPA